MTLRKFKADQLFTGYELLDGDKVLITDESGKIKEIVQKSEAGDNVEIYDGILCPGLINCHCHLELSHMKGLIPQQTGLVDFVLNVVNQRHFPEAQILQAIEKAEDEMLANGIVAVGDICNNAYSLVQKAKGRIYYHNFIEASGFTPTIAKERFEQSLEYFKVFAQYYSIPIESNSIVPHAPYSVADELWDLIVNFPGNHLLTMHNQEAQAENQWFIDKTGDFFDLFKKMNLDVEFFQPRGRSSLQSVLPRFLPNQSVILVHNVHTTAEDLEFLNLANESLRTAQPGIGQRKLKWCLCPNANLYISNQLPPIDLFIKYDCELVLGTDSLASNNQLSILEEIKTIKKHFTGIEWRDLLKWATINGAKALQMDKLLGSFEINKLPGIVLIDNEISGLKRIL